MCALILREWDACIVYSVKLQCMIFSVTSSSGVWSAKQGLRELYLIDFFCGIKACPPHTWSAQRSWMMSSRSFKVSLMEGERCVDGANSCLSLIWAVVEISRISRECSCDVLKSSLFERGSYTAAVECVFTSSHSDRYLFFRRRLNAWCVTLNKLNGGSCVKACLIHKLLNIKHVWRLVMCIWHQTCFITFFN